MFIGDDKKKENANTEPTNTANIIVFPDYEKLKERVERLRTEISMLLLERDELQFVVCRNIETVYMLELGSLEYKAYEAQCTFLRLKRKLELIQAKINRQEKVILSKIDDTLDQEFAEYQQKLDEQINKMNEAIEHSKGTRLTDEENKEIKKTYRKIVKNLHPDLNPHITENQKKLFENAVEAYKHGNLEMLKIIGEMVSEPVVPEKSVDAMTMLKENADSLDKMVSVIRKNIDDIKNRYPYTMKDIVEDKEKIEQRRTEIQSILEQYNDGISLYQTKINELMRC